MDNIAIEMESTFRLWSVLRIGSLLLFCACREPASQQTALPFEFTNIVYGVSAFNKTPLTGTFIYFMNGSWFSHYPDRSSLGFGASDYEITVFFDSTNRAVRKIIQQTTVGTNRYWLTDRNGDGLPDERQAFGDKVEEVLFKGEWVEARGKASREIILDGNWTPIQFVEGAWRLKEL